MVGAGWDWSRAMPGGGRKLRPIRGQRTCPGRRDKLGLSPKVTVMPEQGARQDMADPRARVIPGGLGWG